MNNHHHGTKAKYKCELFSLDDRKEVHKDYWQLGENYKAKKNFLLQFTRKVAVERRKISQVENGSKRQTSYQYFLPKNGASVAVCKDFFCKTLGKSLNLKINVQNNHIDLKQVFHTNPSKKRTRIIKLLPILLVEKIYVESMHPHTKQSLKFSNVYWIILHRFHQ